MYLSNKTTLASDNHPIVADIEGIGMTKFCYEHITGKSYDEYIDGLKKRGLAFDVTETSK